MGSIVYPLPPVDQIESPPLSLYRPPPAKLSTTSGSQTAVPLSSGGGKASTPPRNSGTVITVRVITTTVHPGGGYAKLVGHAEGAAIVAGANDM